MAEQIQHILIHIWPITSRSDGTKTALVKLVEVKTPLCGRATCSLHIASMSWNGCGPCARRLEL